MRYYQIIVDGQTLYTSHPNGIMAPPDPFALQVELDIIAKAGSNPVGGSFVRIWGIGLDMIGQAKNLTNKSIEVYGGMGVGYPLATLQSKNAGLLAKGLIYPAFGNWVLTDMTLDLIMVPGGTSNIKGVGGPNKPANMVHNWQPGTKLADAITQTLKQAYPTLTPVVNISDSLVLKYADVGFYQNFEQYAGYIEQISLSIMNGGKPKLDGNYLGVQMSFAGGNINVFDGTKPASNTKEIAFTDLLGQPTWIGLNTISVKTVMRGDLNVGDAVTMPPSLATTQASSAPQLRTESGFQGTFQVLGVRHVGNFRQPDGMSWNSTFELSISGSSGD